MLAAPRTTAITRRTRNLQHLNCCLRWLSAAYLEVDSVVNKKKGLKKIQIYISACITKLSHTCMCNYQSFVVRGFPLGVNHRSQKRGFPTVYHILIFSRQLKVFVVFEQIPGKQCRNSTSWSPFINKGKLSKSYRKSFLGKNPSPRWDLNRRPSVI